MMAKAKTKEEKKEEKKEAEKKRKEELKNLSVADRREKMRRECAKNILKSFGKGSTRQASETSYQPLRRISSGSLNLDHALGGGWPRGRVSVIWGPRSCNKTTLMLKMIADAQQRDAITNQYLWQIEEKKRKDCLPIQCAFVNVEGTLDLRWAEMNGVNLKFLEIGNPKTQEEAADMCEAYMSSGYDIVVLDSLAAMTPIEEIQGSTGDHNMGVAARKNNRMLRKVQMVMNRVENEGEGLEPSLFIINQERHKIGCFTYDTKILLADGTTEKIGKIVNQKISREVFSYNRETDCIEPKKIIDWHNNGLAEESFLRIKAKGGNNGIVCMTCTQDHIVFAFDGKEVRADSLSEGDLIKFCGHRYYNDDQHELILGSLLGDGGIRYEKNSIRGHLRVGHGMDQAEYCSWKASMLHCDMKPVISNKAVYFISKKSEEFFRYNLIIQHNGLYYIPDEWIKKITPKVAAIWYQDDGTFSGSYAKWGNGTCNISATKLGFECMKKISEHFDFIGMGKPSFKEGRGFFWSGKESGKFQAAIEKYVHPSMRYKIKNKKNDFDWPKTDLLDSHEVCPIEVDLIETYIPQDKYHAVKYDITVEGNHNYFAGGFLVHNCLFGDPRVKPGGKGQDFHSSIELMVWGNQVEFYDTDKKLPKWTKFGYRVSKNKTAPPQIEGEYKMALVDDPDGKFQVSDIVEANDVMEFASRLGIFKKVSDTKWQMYEKFYKRKSDLWAEWVDNRNNFLNLKQDLVKRLFPNTIGKEA